MKTSEDIEEELKVHGVTQYLSFSQVRVMEELEKKGFTAKEAKGELREEGFSEFQVGLVIGFSVAEQMREILAEQDRREDTSGMNILFIEELDITSSHYWAIWKIMDECDTKDEIIRAMRRRNFSESQIGEAMAFLEINWKYIEDKERGIEG